MAKLHVISFEQDLIRCIAADLRGVSQVLVSSETLPASELENYFARNRAVTSYIVVGNFQELHQDTLYLPVIDEKQLPLIVSGEIRRNHPELGAYSFFFRVIGDTYQDGRMYRKVSAFVYANEDLTPVLDRFISCNKNVTALYSSTDALSQLLSSSPDISDETIIGIADLGEEKSIFVLENRALSFSRLFHSPAKGFTALDVQNLNMTIDYFFQSLRLKPARAYLLNSYLDFSTLPQKMFLPQGQFVPAPGIVAEPEVMQDYAIAIGALGAHSRQTDSSILPEDYWTYFTRKTFFSRGAKTLAGLSLLVLLFMGTELFKVLSLASESADLRRSLALQQKVQDAYGAANESLTQTAPLLSYITTAHQAVDLQRTLVALNALRRPGVQLTGISLSAEDDGSLLIAVKGIIAADRLVAMQHRFEELVAEIGKLSGIELNTQRLEGKDRTFTIEARRRPV